MSLSRKLAALKETVDTKKQETIVGRYAKYVANSVMAKMGEDGDLAVVYLKRQKLQGWPGHFLPAVGVEVEQILNTNGLLMHFDDSASKKASQTPVTHGYGNPAFPSWREDQIGLVFTAPQPAMAEVIQLQPPQPTKEATLQAA